MKKNVLVCLPSLADGDGIARFYMNYYNKIIFEGYNIDFLCISNKIYENNFIKKIKQNEGEIFVTPKHSKFNKFTVLARFLNEILTSKEYEIIHINLIDIYAYVCCKEAKKRKINKIIYHVHNPKSLGKLLFISNWLNYQCIKMSTNLVACTEHAGKSMFGKRRFEIVRNAFDTEKYGFDKYARKEYRDELNIDNNFVIGSVGRITSQKNPIFVLEIIKELKKINKNVSLIWIGNGNLKEKFTTYIKKYELEKNVIILEKRDDLNKLYSAMDVFLLPSKYEGLGIVFLEAQCSGLRIYTSTKVPKEIKITKLVNFLELKNNAKYWAKIIYEGQKEKTNRTAYIDKLNKSNYNLKNNDRTLIKIYE